MAESVLCRILVWDFLHGQCDDFLIEREHVRVINAKDKIMPMLVIVGSRVKWYTSHTQPSGLKVWTVEDSRPRTASQAELPFLHLALAHSTRPGQ